MCRVWDSWLVSSQELDSEPRGRPRGATDEGRELRSGGGRSTGDMSSPPRIEEP